MPNFRLYVHRGPDAGSMHELYGNVVTIGRDIPNHIVMNDGELSRYHCRLLWNGDSYWVEDLGSSNGTYVNGQLVNGSQPLAHGDSLEFGETVLCTYYDMDRSAEPPAPRTARTGGPRYRLILQGDSGDSRLYALHSSVVSIGRDPANDIVIIDPELSRQHCRLIWDGDGYSVEDLGSTNGTYLNGERISGKYDLRNGDLLMLGHHVALQYGTGATSTLPVIDIERHREALAEQLADELSVTQEVANTGFGPSIFVSYSHKDADFAYRLAGDLRAMRYEVWIDFGAVNGGQLWADEIENALRRSHAVIVVLSPDALQSSWVRKEIMLAVNLQKQIVPALVADVELPLPLIDIQYVDFRDDYSLAMRHLFDIL